MFTESRSDQVEGSLIAFLSNNKEGLSAAPGMGTSEKG
jgi:hypothetical protein